MCAHAHRPGQVDVRLEIKCMLWQGQGWGRSRVRISMDGRSRGSPLAAVITLGAGSQLSSESGGNLFNFLCSFILLRRICTRWSLRFFWFKPISVYSRHIRLHRPHPEVWSFAYFICPLVPERSC